MRGNSKMKIIDLLEFKNVQSRIKIIAFITSLLNFICTLILPLLIKKLIDTFNTGINISTLIVIIVFFIIQMLSIGISSYYLSMLGSTLVVNLRNKLWRTLLHLKYSYFTKNLPGEIVSRLLSNTTAAVNLIALELPRIIISVLTLIGSLIILFYLDPFIGFLAMLIFPILLLIVIPCSRKLRKITYQHYEFLSNMSGYFFSILSNIKMIKSFNMQEHEYKSGHKHINKIFINDKNRAITESFVNSIINSVTSLSIYLIIGFGFYRVITQNITMGDLLASIFYLFTITAPISNIANFVVSYANFSGVVSSLIDTLNYEQELDRKSEIINNNIKYLNRKSSEINFKSVSFSYNTQKVLKDVNINIPKSSFTAIVGESGSGKTTLFYLLERFHENFSGDILINNNSINEISSKRLRELVSYVPQENDLVYGTILENILYGINKEVSINEVIEFCKRTNSYNFILELSDGFNTMIGGKENNLSTGQKQRLAITRALIKDSPILLLDESTSNLDSISESFIKKIIEDNVDNKTIIVIAHKMSLIEKADQIIIMDHGRVVGVGKHNNLRKYNEKYIELLKNS